MVAECRMGWRLKEKLKQISLEQLLEQEVAKPEISTVVMGTEKKE